MDSGYLLRLEHEEFAKRVDEEQHRQNERLRLVEESVRQNEKLTLSVEKMALSMEIMSNELKAQGERLERLEDAPTRNWNTIKAAVLSAIGTAIGAGIIAAVANYL